MNAPDPTSAWAETTKVIAIMLITTVAAIYCASTFDETEINLLLVLFTGLGGSSVLSWSLGRRLKKERDSEVARLIRALEDVRGRLKGTADPTLMDSWRMVNGVLQRPGAEA